MSPIHTVYENMFVSGGSNKQPSSDVLFSRLSDRMLRESIDYDYVDECQLRESTLVKGEGLRFTVNENIYSVIVLPEIEVMTKDVAQFLLSFVKQGGTLITIGTIPQHSESLHQDPALAAIMQELFPLQPLHAELHKVDKGYSLFYSLKEQKDAAPAESAVEEQTVEQHVSLERFCVRLREMLSRSPAIRWRLIEGQSGDLITVERVFGNRVFAWLMNWSEQSISLQLESGAVPSMIEEWDLESGKISPFNQDAVLSFAPGELRVVSVQTPLQTSTEMLQEAKSGAVRISEDIVLLPEKWQFQAVDGNVFLLDQWQVTLNDRQSRMNATMPGQVNTYRTVFNVSSALMERLQSKRGISYPEGSLKDRFAKVELILDDVQQRIPSHIGFLQRRRNLEIFVNGVRQNSLQPSSWQDSYYDSLDITSQIKAGENELEILTVSLLEPMPAISFPAYLVGSFIIEDQMTLNVESEHICGTWDTAGYPYYSGAGVYTQHVDLSPSDLDASDEIWLEAEDIRETACLYVNDKEAGVRLWPPYHWNITDFVEQGSNRVTLQVANTLDNLYGKALLCSGVNGRVKLVRRSWR
ncbi:glycosylhydrolase-like jelly roll fold domain-containing protein [Paenibacillus sp. JCM 10914]|uniref:glycosylhydrolase-like jelly roll fold domain-containing protein n=1 Tax=Paenibacillus sp. JCM 10914 TaxID=1236974 RepID=UPI0003CC68BD|nr:glycosylhydrolase-like jelly roll fold domain-containing protein [Paenibacillus sp. JCM 10914]GAE09177.1 conserved hypothetical protein [Paenibacillus sp. JCM 10914]